MKFKKDDLGLYFAFALVGGGIGLFVGAFLTSWIERRSEEQFNAEEAARDEALEEDLNRWIGPNEAKLRAELAAERLEQLEKASEGIKEEEGYEVVDLSDEKWEKYLNLPETPKKEKKVSRKQKESLYENRSRYSNEELMDFIAEHDPNPFSQQMLFNGTMTMEQVLGVIEQETLAMERESYNYAQQYHEDNVEDAEEEGDYDEEYINNPPRDLGIIDDRFHILTGPPENSNDLTAREIQWDKEDNSFYMIWRNEPMNYDIETGIGHDAWAVVEPYLLRGFDDIYVVDLQKNRYYKFYKMPELGEDDSVLDDGSSDN